MTAPPPPPSLPGLTSRPATLEDAEAIAQLIAAVDEVEGLEYAPGPEGVRFSLSFPGLDLGQDTLLAVFPDGAPAAFGWVWVKEVSRKQRTLVWIEIHPAYVALEGAVLAWAEGRARAHIAAHPDLPGYLRLHVEEHRLRRRRAVEEAGYHHARTFVEMHRPVPTEPLAPPPLPPGISVVPWSAALDDSTRLAANDAFSLHWDVAALSTEEWQQRVSGDGIFRPDLSHIALLNGEVVALCLATVDPEHNARAAVSEVWIERVGTRREWQRRGLAAALVQHTLAAAAAAGMERAGLSVDQDNATRASTLYERLGFAATRRTLAYVKEVG